MKFHRTSFRLRARPVSSQMSRCLDSGLHQNDAAGTMPQAITCPAVLISAPASGQGKTLTSAALARAWRNQGMVVQAFKAGPDFLDPMILEAATGRPVYNLDLAMCGLEDGLTKLYQAAQTADVIIVEGVMGLFDGTPSSADIAVQYGLPVLLTIDASGMAQTFGALAAGLLGYRQKLKSAGVLANKVGSTGHAKILQDSLPEHLSWFGALPRDAALSLPERHLGLFVASEIEDLDARIEAAAKALSENASESGKLPLPPSAAFKAPNIQAPPQLLAEKTIAIARDEAFCFIYQANLDCLTALGATLKFFSLLHDQALPQADAYWLPGGYPELHPDLISANIGMKKSLEIAFENNTPILAECGGMMALTESIGEYAGYGVLPGQIAMTQKLQGLGTQFAELQLDETLPKSLINAHTFHYSKFATALSPLAHATTQRNNPGEAIYRHGSIIATYLHFYFPSNPQVAAALFLPANLNA